MLTAWTSDKTIVTRLRVRSSGLDPLTTQLRVTILLNAARLHPSGLAPSAILCIRALRDPLPGALKLQHGGARPPPAWEEAVEAALDELAQRAARPAQGFVPAHAEAVIFADQAELLACLASDWCAGAALAHWWWQGLLRNTDIASAVLTAWRAAHEYVPAALQQLAESGTVVSFVRRLDERAARELLEGITHRFALHALSAALDIVLDDDRRSAREALITILEAVPSHSDDRGAASKQDVEPSQLSTHHSSLITPAAPWQRWAPESAAPELAPAQQCLLGVALMLQRAPNVVRVAWFPQAVIEWHAAKEAAESNPPFAHAAAPRGFFAPEGDKPRANPGVKDDERRESASSSIAEVDERPTAKSGVRDDERRESASSSIAEVDEQPVANAEPSLIETRESADEARVSESPARASSPRAEPNRAQATGNSQFAILDGEIKSDYIQTLKVPEVIETEMGGVFYLINLALYLNLYGDFTTPLELGIVLSPWDFMALFGREFCGEKILTDPVWSLLARLAGRRDDEPPGRNFDPPDEWRMSADWLTPFTTQDAWEWTAVERRLRVRHPAQFLVLDVPRTAADAIEQLQDEMRVYLSTDARHQMTRKPSLFDNARVPPSLRGASFATKQSPRASPSETASQNALAMTSVDLPPVQRWLTWLMPYLRARLNRALGLTEVDDLARVVFEHHARVFVTAARLDIVFSLAALPIEIRYAGLDRDPGWMPAAGRFIAFHFE